MKKMLPFFLLLFFGISASAQESLYAVNNDAGAMLVNANGEIVFQLSDCSMIYPLYDGYFAGYSMEQDTWCIIDAQGSPVTPFQYEYLYYMDDTLYFGQGNTIGTLDSAFQEAIPCKYTQLVANGEGGYLALTTDPYDDKADGIYAIAQDGTATPTGIRILDGLNTFTEGLMPVFSADTNAFGYLDTNGTWKIAAQYSYAGSFSNGFAEAALDSGLGLIDAEGNWILTPRYASLASNTQGSTMVLAQENSKSVLLIDGKSGKKVKTFTGEEIYFIAGYETNHAEIVLPEQTLLIDENGTVILTGDENAQFTASPEMRDNLIVQTGAWGENSVYLTDASGSALSEGYQEIYYLCTCADAPYYVATTFDTILEEDDDWSGYFLQEDTQQYALLNAEGQIVIPFASDIITFVGDTFVLQGDCLYDLSDNHKIQIHEKE